MEDPRTMIHQQHQLMMEQVQLVKHTLVPRGKGNAAYQARQAAQQAAQQAQAAQQSDTDAQVTEIFRFNISDNQDTMLDKLNTVVKNQNNADAIILNLSRTIKELTATIKTMKSTQEKDASFNALPMNVKVLWWWWYAAACAWRQFTSILTWFFLNIVTKVGGLLLLLALIFFGFWVHLHFPNIFKALSYVWTNWVWWALGKMIGETWDHACAMISYWLSGMTMPSGFTAVTCVIKETTKCVLPKFGSTVVQAAASTAAKSSSWFGW